ncbi:MAG TPA: HAD family phosphatase [Chloroflexia bacterium]|nr:HAD family phosphatase [Chloroflexia bacterium]
MEAKDRIKNSNFGVIWDFDGTIVDTMPVHFSAWQRFMEGYGYTFSEEEFLATAGKPSEVILKKYFNTIPEAELAELGDRKDAMFREESERLGIAIKPGVENLLKALHTAGFKQAIGSGTPRKNLELAYSLNPILRNYIEAEVIAGDTANTKPHPEVFLAAAQKLGLPATNCLVIEDGILGIEAAHRAEMAVIAVTDERDRTIYEKVGASLIVKSLEEVTVDTIEGLLGIKPVPGGH